MLYLRNLLYFLKENALETKDLYHAPSNQFILLNICEKAQKAEGIKKWTKNNHFLWQFSTILGFKMSCLPNKTYFLSTLDVFDIYRQYCFQMFHEKGQNIGQKCKMTKKARKNLQSGFYGTNFSAGGGPFIA